MNSLLLLASLAGASCGSADCPSHPNSLQPRPAGSIQAAYEFEYIPQTHNHIGRRHARSRELRGHHDEDYTITRSRWMRVMV